MQFESAWTSALVVAPLLLFPVPGARAECPTDSDPIATDRPTFANSSSVVPEESLQLENGFGATGNGMTTWDLPETRARLGIGSCTEVLVDLPDYNWTVERQGAQGWTSVAPTIKRQFEGLPDGLTLSGAIGIGLGTGAQQIVGRGPTPYVQLPWSVDLSGGWTANGMYSATFHPGAKMGTAVNQTSVFLDRTVSDAADVFLEYANDYQPGAPTLNRLSVGGSYRYTPLHQVDFKLGTGLNRASPDWYFTMGYSVRFDRLL